MKIFVLIWLSIIDVKKREISLMTMAGAYLLCNPALIKGGNIDTLGFLTGFAFVMVSIVTKQALGLADSLILLLFGMDQGSFLIFDLFFIGLILMCLFEGGRILIRKKGDKSLPFLPFVSFAYLFL